MKKYKKFWAVLLTLAMVLGMSMTTMAAPNDTKSTITVTGLSRTEKETVNLYQIASFDETNSKWAFANTTLEGYFERNADTNAYELKSGITWDMVKTEAEKLVVYGTKDHAEGATTVTFENVDVGLYLVTASGTALNYAPMVAENYDKDAKYITAKNVTVVAKGESYPLTKEQKIETEGDNKFVARGETLTFVITTSFPRMEDPANGTYKIVDQPTGLDIQAVTKVTLGGVEQDVTNLQFAAGSITDEDGNEVTGQVLDLTSLKGTNNENAGKEVVIEYTAIVTAAEGTATAGVYTNVANAYRNNKPMGGDTEEGWTGDITLTKTDDAENAADRSTLVGAEFEVYKNFEEKGGKVTANEADKLYFVKEADGVYKLALSKDETNATSTVVATNGTVQVKGLDEGTYWFKETKAPSGYSINAAGKQVTITLPTAKDDGKLENVSVGATLTDTKLSALPSTGGIGTTIFTIGGCAIMIAAAFLFFASRKKNDNK